MTYLHQNTTYSRWKASLFLSCSATANTQHTHTHTISCTPDLSNTPWCIPRTQRTGNWLQAWWWAVLSPWRSPAEALCAPLWVDPQGWAQPNHPKLKASQTPPPSMADYGKNNPTDRWRRAVAEPYIPGQMHLLMLSVPQGGERVMESPRCD